MNRKQHTDKPQVTVTYGARCIQLNCGCNSILEADSKESAIESLGLTRELVKIVTTSNGQTFINRINLTKE